MEVKDFERYIIYPNGDIKNSKTGRFLKPSYSRDYQKVTLYKKNTRKQFQVHTLVALYYLENRNQYTEVDHIDRNPKNNNVENLRWVSRSENLLNTGVSKNNKLGLKHIFVRNIKGGNTYYLFQIRGTIQKCFKDLQECIEFRNEFCKLNNLNYE